MRRTLFVLPGLMSLAVLIPVGAHADEIDIIGSDVFKLQAEIQSLDGHIKPVTQQQKAEVAERRLIDAQVLYELKNYEAASIILLDIVEKFPNTPVYADALFFLADSLFLKRDFFSSRRYFEKIVEIGPQAARFQEAVQRLVELSLYTGDYGPVDGYLARLQTLSPGKQLPSVPYVKGKYYYFRQKYDESEKAFQDIGPTHPYWFHSQYFLGAAQVARAKDMAANSDGRKERLDLGINTFAGILKVEAKSDAQKRIQELAHLALGRIFYDRGQLTQALTEYSRVPQKSDLHGASLEEQAWVCIKAGDYKKAFRALDLLVLERPDDPIVPEVKLLIGNLHIRQNEYTEATDSFTKTRDEFEPIRKQMEQGRANTDTVTYFKDLIGKNLGKFDASTYLPPLAVKWVNAEPEMIRIINLVTDVGDLKKSLDESEEIVRRLDKALDGPSRINVFPELAHARAQMVDISGRLADAEKKLVNLEGELEAPVATASERSQLEEYHRQRAAIEKKLADNPTDVTSIEARQKRVRAQFDDVDKGAVEIGAIIQTYSAVRVGTESYYHNQIKSGAIKPTPQERADAERYLNDYKGEEEGLRAKYEQLRGDIADAMGSVGSYDVDMQRSDDLRKQLTEIVDKEHELGTSIRARLGGEARTKADQIASILDRAHGSDRELGTFNGKIEDAVEDRLKDIRSGLADEKAHMLEYKRVLGGYEGETIDVGAGVTTENFKMISDRFYNIVVKADVGIIDVAWALKEAKRVEDATLVKEEKRELKFIDDDYKSLLKE